MNKIKAKKILDSRGMPTVRVELETNFGVFRASVPSGVSTGKYEAVELRDEDGRGVKMAIEGIEKVIAPVLEKEDLSDQKRIDEILIQLDGTKNKSRLGANAILAISIAVCRAGAKAKNISLWRYIRQILTANCQMQDTKYKTPVPSFNVIEGGKHARNNLAFQEFMVSSQKESFKENLKIGKEVYKKLKDVLKKKYKEVKLSAEGAFSAPTGGICAVLDLILEAAEKTGHKNDIKIAIDTAASSFFENGRYKIDGKILDRESLIDFYQNLVEKYFIISIEDPFFEEDFKGFAELKEKIGDVITIFGDDLTVSNIERIKKAQENNSCSGLILKPNQIGTITETIEAAKLASQFSWKIMVANRAGETEDNFIADLTVGIGAEFIKSGAPFPKERMAKYNRLLAIEEEINRYKIEIL